MKILDLELVNIQSHEYNKFKFHPNLNVIRGLSDAGKSVIIKGLRLLICNKASKNIRTKKCGERSSVTVSDGEVTISRIIDGDTNAYTLDKSGELVVYKAMRSDVPSEISKELNLSEANIQTQKDTYFLIDKSPGEISRALNKVSGLSSIDLVLKRVNTEINELNAELRVHNRGLLVLQEEVEAKQWSVKAESTILICEKLNNDLHSISEEINSIEQMYLEYNSIKKTILGMLPESILVDADKLKIIRTEYDSVHSELSQIEDMLDQYEKLKNKYESIELIDMEKLPKPSDVSEIIDSMDKINSEILEISSLLNSYTYNRERYDTIDAEFQLSLAEIGKVKLCPTCKRPLK